MKGKTLLSLAIVASMLAAALPTIAVNAAPGTYIKVIFENGTNESPNYVPCQNFTVQARIYDTPDITQYIVELSWDPTVLELETGTDADIVKGDFLGGEVFLDTISGPGAIEEITEAKLFGTKSGSGLLFSVKFHCKAPGDTTIHLVRAILLKDLELVPCNTVDGIVHQLGLQFEGGRVWYWINDTTISSVVEGDVDSDGLVEIVTGGYYYDGARSVAQLAVWNGSTLELEGVTFWYWVGNTTINSIAIGDVDGDGQIEIVTGGCYYDGVQKVAQLAVWDGATLSLEDVVTWYWTGDTCINSVAIKDFVEIVTGGYYNDGTRNIAQLAIWNGQALSLEGVVVWFWVGDTIINSVAVGDVEGDYLTEIVTGGYYNDGVRDVAQLATWNSTLSLENVMAWYWLGDTRINSVATGDVDGDSFVEIVTGGYCDNAIKIAQVATWNGTTLSLEDVTVWFWTGDTRISSVAVRDIDGDGSTEVVTGGSYHDGTYDFAQLVVWKGADLTLKTVTAWQWIRDTGINSLVVGDIDGDSDVETVACGSYHDGTRTIAQLTVWVVVGS